MIKFRMYRLNYSKPTLTSEINLMIEPEINFRKPPKNIKIAVILILNILLAFLNDYIFSFIILKIYFYFYFIFLSVLSTSTVTLCNYDAR